MQWYGIIAGILFLSCLLSTLTFAITFEPLEIETCILVNSTNENLSNDTKVNDLVTLNVTFMLKIAFSDFVVAGGIVFHKQILLVELWPLDLKKFWFPVIITAMRRHFELKFGI